MQDYKTFELSDLFDILSQNTAHYMKMLSGGATKDSFDSCRETIIDIQLEIQSRKIQKSNKKATNADMSFTRQQSTGKGPSS